MKTLIRICVAAALVATGYVAGRLTPEPIAQAAAMQNRVFEMRTYTANEGKLPTLETRFSDHTIKFFNKYDMTSVGYWIPTEGPLADNAIIYILSHPSREAAKANWAKFMADPEWQKVKAASEANGKIVTKVESTFADATDYSPMK